MITLRAWFVDRRTPAIVSGKTTGEAFDKAEALGAVIVEMEYETFVKIGGEFYGMPNARQRKAEAGG